MPITFACPCGKQLRTSDENAGRRVKCPSCGQPVAVPAAAARPASKGPSTPAPAKATTAEVVHFRCDCGKQLQAKPALAGRRVKCPGCGAELVVPGGADGIQAAKPAAKKPAPAPDIPAPRKFARDEAPPKLRAEDREPPEREDGEEEMPRREKRKAKKGLSLPVILGIGAVLLVVVGGGVGAYLYFNKEDSKPPPGPPRPPVVQNTPQPQPAPDLDLVPRDAVGFASLRVNKLWNSPTVQMLVPLANLAMPGRLQEIENQIGLTAADVERATLVILAPDPDQAYLIVSTNKDCDPSKVLAFLAPDAEEMNRQGKTYHAGKETALHFVNNRLIVMGPPPVVEKFLDKPPQPEATGPLGEALKLAALDHHLVVGANPPSKEIAELRKDLPPQAKSYEDLLDAKGGTLTASLGTDLELELRLDFEAEDKARQAHQAAQKGLKEGLSMLDGLKQQFAQDPNMKAMIQNLAPLEKSLQNVAIEQSGAMVKLGLKTEGGLGPVIAGLAPVVIKQIQSGAKRAASDDNLKQLATAMLNYESAYGSFPPAVIHQDGKPLYSWRVALLPFLGEKELYDQFRKEEPWDSPDNLKLLAKMPAVFAPPPGPTPRPASATHYQVLVSSEKTDASRRAPFGGALAPKIASFKDGTSNTLLIVEAAEPVPWTKPVDAAYEPDKPLPRLGGLSPDGFHAAFADGSVRFVESTTPEVVLRALITPAGGEKLP